MFTHAICDCFKHRKNIFFYIVIIVFFSEQMKHVSIWVEQHVTYRSSPPPYTYSSWWRRRPYIRRYSSCRCSWLRHGRFRMELVAFQSITVINSSQVASWDSYRMELVASQSVSAIISRKQAWSRKLGYYLQVTYRYVAVNMNLYSPQRDVTKR